MAVGRFKSCRGRRRPFCFLAWRWSEPLMSLARPRWRGTLRQWPDAVRRRRKWRGDRPAGVPPRCPTDRRLAVLVWCFSAGLTLLKRMETSDCWRRSLWTKTAGARDCLQSSSVIKVGAGWPWALFATIAVFPEWDGKFTRGLDSRPTCRRRSPWRRRYLAEKSMTLISGCALNVGLDLAGREECASVRSEDRRRRWVDGRRARGVPILYRVARERSRRSCQRLPAVFRMRTENSNVLTLDSGPSVAIMPAVLAG